MEPKREHITLRVGSHEGGTRLDRFISSKMDELSTREAARLVTARGARVNGSPAAKGRKLAVGDEILVDVSLLREAQNDFSPVPNPEMSIRVLHADERTLVVDKPVMVHTAPLRPDEVNTVVNGALALAPQMSRVKGFRLREAGLVHRLDGPTSGACLLALDQDAFDRLRTASETDQVMKDYTAVVHGKMLSGPPSLEATVPPSGGRGRRVDVRTVKRIRSRNLSPAKLPDGTRVLRMRMEILETKRDFSHLRLKLSRGFRHQVRAILEAMGHPVVGDSLYGPRPCWPELLLHSSRLVFPHPDDGRLVRVDSPSSRLEDAFLSLSKGRAGRT